ncbi:uncharacterized protein XM38_011690 [Halomicronema hongdechloris C2206]|uniref:Uncharacterized protein n=1 Tax=Halomicronema hongdechloris C2206 TaxID=1641165 RepID=A0A1Z3HIX6_9CYAN|nr:hypothetical protein [Halomicronema hongdechloris]ASC70233.1 uncharacterized protein XM38_011690 [Halomicronema hongdechloris C2206]
MAVPNSLRYTWARLQPFRLLLLCSGLVVVLLGVILWERRTHPEWSGLFQTQTPGPNPAANGSSLTPEEQAGIAEIDSLSILLSDIESGQSPGSILGGELGETDALASDSLLSALQASSSPGSNGESGLSSQSPFAAYLERYDFSGRSSTSSDQPSASNGFDSSTESSLTNPDSLLNLSNLFRGLGATSAETATAAPSPLQQAMNQQVTAQTTEPGRSQARRDTQATDTADGRPAVPTLPGAATAETSPIPFPLIRTTPQMSPPPGTTGYTVPNTLNLAPPQASTDTNAYTNLFPNSPTSTGTAGGRIAPVTPGNGTSSNGVGPSGLPSPANTGTTYNQPDARLQEASPFAVPGAPGSRIGGGYIYTFSDPNGPVD